MNRKKPSKRKNAGLMDRLQLWCSTNKRIDGLWVGTIEREPERLLDRVERALAVIKVHDRVRYNRLIQDLDRVWVRLVSYGLAAFNASINACELDTRFVRAETSSPEQIAAMIVHEATHARLDRAGIGYDEDLRAHVEAVCLRREIAFASRLPNGAQICERAERLLTSCGTHDDRSDRTLSERHLEGSVEALRYLGGPEWLVRTLAAVGALRLKINRRLRGQIRR